MTLGSRRSQRGRIQVVFLQAVEAFVYVYGLPFYQMSVKDVQAWGMRNAEEQRGHI